MNTETVQFL